MNNPKPITADSVFNELVLPAIKDTVKPVQVVDDLAGLADEGPLCEKCDSPELDEEISFVDYTPTGMYWCNGCRSSVYGEEVETDSESRADYERTENQILDNQERR